MYFRTYTTQTGEFYEHFFSNWCKQIFFFYKQLNSNFVQSTSQTTRPQVAKVFGILRGQLCITLVILEGKILFFGIRIFVYTLNLVGGRGIITRSHPLFPLCFILGCFGPSCNICWFRTEKERNLFSSSTPSTMSVKRCRCKK